MREEVLHTIFLELHKVYYALYKYRCLDILEVCGVGPSSLRLLCRYWEMLHMVGQAGGYYGEPFRGERGVNQGGALLPTI